MHYKKTRQVALSGILFALAITLSLVENSITPLLGLLPGVKIGLANIVVMYALFFMGTGQAAILVVLKALFSLLFYNPTAGFLSLCGGMLSLLVMLILYKIPWDVSYFIISVCGALGHNAGQLIGASVVLSNMLTLIYFPVLLVSGLLMGFATAGSLSALLPALKKIGFSLKKD